MGLFSLFGKRDSEDMAEALPRERNTQSDQLARTRMRERIEPTTDRHPPHPAHAAPPPKKPPQQPLAAPAVISQQAKALRPASSRDDTTLVIGPDKNLTAQCETTPTIDEAALMFSLGSTSVAEELLHSVIRQKPRMELAQQAWAMLFDLYEVLHRRDLFDRLSISYARHFEASPPSWHDTNDGDHAQAHQQDSETALRFAKHIDANAKHLLDTARAFPAATVHVRLEFSGLLTIDAAGCTILLTLLSLLQKSAKNIQLVSAPSLVNALKTLLQPPRRETGSDGWLLLMEVYRHLNQESAFEECSMEYCITFEVSPPAFSQPKTNPSAPALAKPQSMPDAYLLPKIITELSPASLQAIRHYADTHQPARFDCSALTRIDFNAAGLLMNSLQEMARRGKVIEFFQLNHLVMALFKIIVQQDLIELHARR